MSRSASIPAEKSRFAALKVDDLSEDSDSGSESFQVVKSANKSKRATPGAPSSSKAGDAPTVSSSAAKNAKKRARKKNKLQGSGEPSAALADLSPIAQGTGGQAQASGGPGQVPAGEDARFHRDLERAMAQSTSEAEKHRERLRMAGLYQEQSTAGAAPSALQSDGRPSSNGIAGSQAAGQRSGKQSTLEPNHTGDGVTEDSSSLPRKEKKKKKAKSEASADVTPADHDRVEEARKLCVLEVKRTTTFKRIKLPDDDAESVRIAELTDHLEKKDASMAHLVTILVKMEEQLNEVKRRNKQLCHIMSRGEMSEKSELVQQVEDLTAQQQELTSEVAQLSSQLEQERTKSKTKAAKKT